MKTSEFWDAVDSVFGPTLGRSYAADLYLPAISGTCLEALEAGLAPQRVWEALVDETGVGESCKWFHRLDAKAKRSLR
ncbi:DUF3046 domain-containing protein [Schaalia cardiffensis]|uniref:DUF3046 domain-containing protein n=1 Tax=Schaalia cardiffensis F0333 TaxID=888050 RepID=N6X7H0_9ACTO|nr:DUF3046 domain-containing protein [Schaalia cardiffensis]ENO19237.1 hypothetical protein HMPREF9004_0156 [Schaalia cardiffensis F0333]MBJ2329003.1 DUF3046 domain-containing protein [Schaalia cardiffensis]